MQLTGWQNLKLGRGRPEQALEFFPELEEHLGRRSACSRWPAADVALGGCSPPSPGCCSPTSCRWASRRWWSSGCSPPVRAAADRGGRVLVEQHVRQALAVADRVHVLRRGRIVMSGDAADLRTMPRASPPTTSR